MMLQLSHHLDVSNLNKNNNKYRYESTALSSFRGI